MVQRARFRLLIGFGSSLFVAAACATFGAWATPGCTTHQCDTGYIFIGEDAGTVYQTSATEIRWESAPFAGPWLEYPGNHTVVVKFPPALAAYRLVDVSAYVSLDPDPRSFTGAFGQLAEFSDASTTGLSVLNATCQNYFLRLEVRASPSEADGGPPAEADAFEAGAVE